MNIKISFAVLVILTGLSGNLRADNYSVSDWPQNGYSAYPDNDGSEIVIRDSENRCVGLMQLDTPNIIDFSNVVESILYEEKYGIRWATRDHNKNGVADLAYQETFDSYALGENPMSALSTIPFGVGGSESKGQGIMGTYLDRWLQVYLDSPFSDGVVPFVPLRIFQKESFSQSLDFSDSYISFELRTTGIAADIPQALTVEVTAHSYHPDTGSDLGYLPWRLQNYPFHAAWYIDNPAYLYPLPAVPEGTVLYFNVNDLVFTDTGSWKQADFSDVSKVEIMLLQVETEAGATELNDWVAKGVLAIDTIKVGRDNEPYSRTPLETELIVDSVESDSFKPGDRVTVTLKSTKTGAVVETVTDLCVFDSNFTWGTISESKIYDSAQVGESVVSHTGLGETAQYQFTFDIPADAPAGDYRVFGSIRDNDGTILDTTGPEVSLHDATYLAYQIAFSISEHIANKPVALFDWAIEDPDNDDIVLHLDASRSFHPNSSLEINTYAWDLDTNGLFEYVSATSGLSVVIPANDIPETLPITLKISDNAVPSNIATKTQVVSIARHGSLAIHTDYFDNESISPAKCFLFASGYDFIEAKSVNDSSVAIWNDLPAASYISEIYIYSDSIFPGLTLSAIESVVVTAGTQSDYEPEPNTPYVSSVEIQYADTGAVFVPDSSPAIAPGRLMTFQITVRNDSDYDRICNVALVLDKNKDHLFDISATPSDDLIVPAGQSIDVSFELSLPEPENEAAGNLEQYWYAVKVETDSIAGRVKTSEYGWNKAFDVEPITARTVIRNELFGGYIWDVVKFFRFAGLTADNVWRDNDGNLMLRVQDYSGVGGELVTPRTDYHYGLYKAAMKVTPTPTQLPEGTVMAFFHYWQSESETELQEIDVELRSVERNGANSTSYAAFTVHSKKMGDSITHYISYHCPVENIEQEHIYEFRWKSDEIAFYIDGELAYDKNNEPAIVNESCVDSEGELFVGRIPDQPGRMIINHWAGDWNNTWAGSAPQGTGDFIATVRYIAYEPVQVTYISSDASSQTVLAMQPYDTLSSVSYDMTLYAIDALDGLHDWYILEDDIVVDGNFLYTDQDSINTDKRFYRLHYK